MLRTNSQINKTNDLPVGISQTWRQREERSPYLEFQVAYINSEGKGKVKHIYIGVDPTPKQIKKALKKALKKAKDLRMRYVTMKDNRVNFLEL